MLERATACVEPAAYHLLRRFDVPTKSNRVLRQSFWRRGGDDLVGPVWWLEYLHNARRSSQALLQADRDTLRDVGVSAFSGVEDTGKQLVTFLQRHSVQAPRPSQELQSRVDLLRQNRSYSRSCRRFQERGRQSKFSEEHVGSGRNENAGVIPQGVIHKPPKYDVRFSMCEGKIGNPPRPTPSIPDSSQNRVVQSSKSSLVHSSDAKLLSLLQERQNAFDEAWRLFVSLQAQETFARRMLRYLSNSKRRIDHERAVRAYKMLSADRKTERTYANALRVAISQRSQRLALEINHEALSRSLGSESSKIFFTYLVRNNLWNTMAQALDDVLSTQKRLKVNSTRGEHQRMQTSNHQTEQDRLWKQIWVEVDEMVQLPEKVLVLMRRTERASPLSPLKEPKVKRLAAYLLYRVVQSPRIMSVINGNGFLTLFRHYAKLDLLLPNHYYQAIRTLHSMIDSGNRSQLAALAYRNLRFHLPEIKVPRWVFGSLISIFTDAAQPSHSMRFLLEQFASMHGRPDPKAYQKVMVACARLGDVEGVYEVFRQFSDTYGLPQDVGYITPLLYVHARLGDIASTHAQFDRLTSEFHVKPDTYCWNILLASYTRARDTAGAFKILQEMKQLGVKLDVYSYGTLMGLCANNGDTEAVHNLVDMARRDNISGTTGMVDSLAHAYCLNDEPESAKDLVEAATNMSLEGSPTRMWNTLLRYYAFQADSEAVLRMQTRMRELSVKPDGMTYAALMTALVVIGKTQDAARILRSLHFNERLTATLFHYSIVLHGFATEGKRDMVSVIYNEILERFPRPSVSARLAVLRSQARRDITVWRTKQVRDAPVSRVLQLPRALDFLADVLLETNQADLATKDPQPGFQRRSPVEALPSIYMEYLIHALNAAGAFYQAEKLLERCQSLIDTSYLSEADKTKGSIQLLTAHMIGCIKKKEFARVDNCWNLIVARALSDGKQLPRYSESFAEDLLLSTPPPRPSSVEIVLPESGDLFGAATSFPSPSEEEHIRVVPSERYRLAAPLTHYMQALGAQNLISLVPGLVEKLKMAGFALNSKNYNTYVQVLTQSANPKHQFQAFQVFEEKFLPNMPPWSVLRRGKWIPRTAFDRMEQVDGLDLQSESEPASEPVARKVIEKFRPGQLVPTYYTMIFLGSALMRFQRRGAKGDEMNLRRLRVHAPGTVEAVLKLPYLRDRVQGVLLRGREVKGDFVKRPRRPPVPDRAGLRGSKSPLDHIPIDHSYHDPVQRVRPDITDSANSKYTPPYLQDAQKYAGEILRRPAVMDRTGRSESNLQFRNRLQREGQEKFAVARVMRGDAKKERLVSDAYFGEPQIDSTNFKTEDVMFRKAPLPKPIIVSERQPVLLDQARESLERVWEARGVGRVSYPVLPPARLRIGKRRYPKKERLAPPPSKVPPEHFLGDRSADLKQLTRFKLVLPPTKRQIKAFSLNKRGIQRRKVFRQRDVAMQNRASAASKGHSTRQLGEGNVRPTANYQSSGG